MPYGVQHGNITAQSKSSLTRNPSELVAACASGWLKVLKTGGVLVLAWNSFVLSRKDFAAVLESAGFQVLNEGTYLEFEHRVDQSIRRDIIVAKKV